MSGLLRNLLTLFLAFFRRNSAILREGCICTFWVTPFDVGIRTLKSDKYLQLIEAAQLDFGVRSGLVSRMRRLHCAMVNVEQHVLFSKPIKLLDKVCIHTKIASADTKFVHFSHTVYVRSQQCATITVKAKFKTGRITQSALDLTEPDPAIKSSTPSDSG